MKHVFIFLAEGFEETEAIVPLDMLRRAGIDVKTVSVTGNKTVTGAHGIAIIADLLFNKETLTDGFLYILPGGMPGTRNLQQHAELNALLGEEAEKGKYLAAICAAPLVYGNLGLLEGKRAVCYPGFEQELKGAVVTDDAVCVDGNFITSKGPGTATAFALTLISLLSSPEKAQEVAAGMLLA